MKSEIEFLQELELMSSEYEIDAAVSMRIQELEKQSDELLNCKRIKNYNFQKEIILNCNRIEITKLYEIFKKELLNELSEIEYQYINNIKDDKSIISIGSFFKGIKQILQEKE